MRYFSLCDSVTIVRDDINFGDGGIVLKGIDLVKISGFKKWSNALWIVLSKLYSDVVLFIWTVFLFT